MNLRKKNKEFISSQEVNGNLYLFSLIVLFDIQNITKQKDLNCFFFYIQQNKSKVEEKKY